MSQGFQEEQPYQLRMMSNSQIQKIKAAVVGGGSFGEIHLKTLASMPQVEVAGLYTLEQDRSRELCLKYGGKSYESLLDLVSDPVVDLVTIATPEYAHLEAFKEAVSHGKAVYVEKPLASTLDDARRMLAISEAVPAMSGHLLHFEQRVAHLFAKLRGVRKHHLAFRGRRTRLEKEIYGRVHPSSVILCHEIELSNAFAESSFQRVLAMETRFSEGQVDGITILIEYENGVTSSVEGGWFLPAQNGCTENDFISIVSEAGVDELGMPHLGNYSISAEGMQTPNLFYGFDVYGVEYGPLRAAFDYFVSCILNGTKPQISTIQDGFDAVQVIEGALLSVRENRWVTRQEMISQNTSSQASTTLEL